MILVGIGTKTMDLVDLFTSLMSTCDITSLIFKKTNLLNETHPFSFSPLIPRVLEGNGLSVCPHIATVTYLGGSAETLSGAPTLILDIR